MWNDIARIAIWHNGPRFMIITLEIARRKRDYKWPNIYNLGRDQLWHLEATLHYNNQIDGIIFMHVCFDLSVQGEWCHKFVSKSSFLTS